MVNITQKELEVVRDNEIDSLGNRIKLKSSSMVNLGNHRINVPFATVKDVNSALDLPVEDKSYTLLSDTFAEVINGHSKPINVKDKMINSIRSKYNNTISVVSDEAERPSLSKFEDVTVDDYSNKENDAVNIQEEVTVSEVSEDNDINKMYQEVTNTREKLLNIKQEAVRAENDANESEKKVQELGVEFNETEKTLQEAEARKQEIQKKIIFELRNQLATMNAEKEKYNDAIFNANQRKEESQNRIIDFESKINDNRQKISSVNDDIAREEEKYNTLLGMNPITSEVEDQYVKRAA